MDEDDDSAISFREFLMIFRKARLGELDMESGLGKLATLSEVDVDAVGVGGAKTFFEAKVIDNSLKQLALWKWLKKIFFGRHLPTFVFVI